MFGYPVKLFELLKSMAIIILNGFTLYVPSFEMIDWKLLNFFSFTISAIWSITFFLPIEVKSYLARVYCQQTGFIPI